MLLHVIRHAIALDTAEMADEDRPLTDEGRGEFAAVVDGLGRIGTRFDLVLHSPLVRAVQTAEMLSPLLRSEPARGERRASAHLAKAPSVELLAELRGDSVAVIGHEPWVSELVAWLLVADRRHGQCFALGKGAVAILEGGPRPADMALVGFFAPAYWRKLRS